MAEPEITIEPMMLADLLTLDVQPMQAAEHAMVVDTIQRTNAPITDANTIKKNGRPIICCGLIPFHPSHMIAWTFIAGSIGYDMVRATLLIRSHLMLTMAMDEVHRISCTVQTGWEEGTRWARLLGFTRECTMRCYGPHGQDYDLWAMVNHNGRH